MNSQQLYGIDAKARRFVELACVLFLAACVLWLVMDFLSGTFGFACPHTVMRKVAVVLFVVFMVSVAAKLILSLFVRENDEQELEAIIERILQEKALSQNVAAMQPTDNSPLVGLDEQGKMLVVEMLKKLPSHHLYPNKINLACVAQFLIALKNLGYLEDEDTKKLRLWVGQVTGKALPSVSQFNEAYSNKSVSKVNKMQEKIRQSLQRLR